MPPKKSSSIGQVSRKSLAISRARSQETSEQTQLRLSQNRERNTRTRFQETEEQKRNRLESNKYRNALHRLCRTVQESQVIENEDRGRHAISRSVETAEQTQVRQSIDRDRHREIRATQSMEQSQTERLLNRDSHREARATQTLEQSQVERLLDRDRHREARATQTLDQSEAERLMDRDRHREARRTQTLEQSQTERLLNRESHREARATQTLEQSQAERLLDRDRHREARRTQTLEQSQTERLLNRESHREARATESANDRSARQIADRNRRVAARNQMSGSMEMQAFNYNPALTYNELDTVKISEMNIVCQYCRAKRFAMEPPGICCSNGKVNLPVMNQPPQMLLDLLSGSSSESKHFLRNIRRYNNCFRMTSFGAGAIIREGDFMPTFKIQGQIYHRAGSLLPIGENRHSFLQMYFLGDENIEANLRQEYIPGTRKELILKLQRFFHANNGLVRVFKTALDQMPTDSHKIVIRADKTPENHHQRTFNAPTVNEAAIVISGDFESRDIVLQKRDSEYKRISETHKCYDALQYPIILWDGQDSYDFNIKLINPITKLVVDKSVSSMQYYSHRLMIRDEDNHLLKCRELLNQFLTDMYAKVESERLAYYRANQSKLRVDEYIHLRDALNRDGNPNDLGQLVILPSTFIGSPRHLNEYAQDAMTYVARYGRPDLFITFTCNPAWEEISKQLLQGQSPMDRHDVVARVFRQKLLELMDLVTKSKIFGEVNCHMLSIEWQKRGLPHAHILIWLNNKILPTQIDSVISAEIPDPETDPVLHNIILRSMIHGPCGVINPKSPCMKDGRCTKNFPKQLLAETVSGNDGYPLYRRRKPSDGGYTAKMRVGNNEIEVDNSWVVPYNPLLSKAFSAHINVEVCNSVKSIKYICKYLYKGGDKAIYGLASEITTGREANDEITKYQSGRYISSDEAVWRIFGFPIHQRYPAVVHLTVHLDGGQRVYYTNRNAQEVAATPPDTTLTAFFKLCQNDTIARTLLYHEVPQYYTWNKTSKLFSRRLQGVSVDIAGQIIKKADTLGRVYTVHPNNAECFYLRMLLHVVKGPRSYNDIKTISGSLCQTFREACQRLGLLEEDNQWEAAMDEAVVTRSPNRIRLFFAIILSSCSPSNPKDLWEKFKKDMSEDILHRLRAANPDLHIEFNADIFNESLIRIENICISMCNKNVEQLGLDAPNRVSDDRDGVIESVILRERNYNVLVLQEFVNSRIAILNVEQRQAYNSVINHISSNRGALIFLDAPGGTGKTFLLNLILASVRKDSGIALAVASSGIAATLLDGGRTAHSTLKIPLDISSIEHPFCNISKSTGEGKLLRECKLIVWDECTMAHKKSLEAVNRTLKDIKGKDEIMGGIVLLLAGDFRQILPVVKNSTPSEELDACLKVSNLWSQVVTLSLTTNMRVQLLEEGLDQQDFTNTLLNVGNGTSNVSGSNELILTSNLCQRVSSSKLLISKVYPNFQENVLNDQWLQERALLAPTNDIVLRINSEIAALILGNARRYLSVDTVMDPNQTLLYATEFLNSLEIPGLPSHKLILKVGVPIMLLRNINPPMLCNGTRLRVNNLLTNIIEATILTGKYNGEKVLIPRIPLITTGDEFEFKRLQFPVKICFAMTINKAQGQSLKVVGVDLSTPCFSHGQFYVAASRVGSPQNLFIYSPTDSTKNIVYQRALK